MYVNIIDWIVYADIRLVSIQEILVHNLYKAYPFLLAQSGVFRMLYITSKVVAPYWLRTRLPLDKIWQSSSSGSWISHTGTSGTSSGSWITLTVDQVLAVNRCPAYLLYRVIYRKEFFKWMYRVLQVSRLCPRGLECWFYTVIYQVSKEVLFCKNCVIRTDFE